VGLAFGAYVDPGAGVKKIPGGIKVWPGAIVCPGAKVGILKGVGNNSGAYVCPGAGVG
jgi:hypothetical protein